MLGRFACRNWSKIEEVQKPLTILTKMSFSDSCHDFSLGHEEENAAMGRARKRITHGTRRMVIRLRGDGEEEEEDKKEGGVGKTGCHFHLVNMGEGVPTAFKYPACWIH